MKASSAADRCLSAEPGSRRWRRIPSPVLAAGMNSSATAAAVGYRGCGREAIKKKCDQLKRADERNAFLAAHGCDPPGDVPFGISVEFQPQPRRVRGAFPVPQVLWFHRGQRDCRTRS